MSANDWIHTRRGVTLVEGTLPRLARALEKLVSLLDSEEVEWEIAYMSGIQSPGPGWEPWQVTSEGDEIIWRRRKPQEKT